ncbi:YggT family protein [Thermodesulfobacteriota bacterium]
MVLLKAIIDFLIVLLLIRLLIRPVEVNFNQIYSLLYRITDYVLKPAKSIVRNDLKSVFLSVLVLVIIRGLIYITTGRFTLLSGICTSLLSLFQLLFQFYMVVWFISILTGDRAHTPVISVLQRAFLPLGSISSKLNIPHKSFSLFSFVLLLVLYSLSSFLLNTIVTYGAFASSFNFLRSVIEGLILIIGLFPGFFTIIIIVGALLSWVSPDPYNPVVQTIYGISEPLLIPFRKIIPNLGGLDISPIAAIFCFWIIDDQLGGLLRKML